ncbi:META domain-containing protein [Gordonia caeni]|uniref:META domain-containing protein n=1 Tax=Gordonia caeni TaxID=1007097 RepID=A0ABP7PL29_9ACTN
MSTYRGVWRVGAILLLITGAALAGCSSDRADVPDPADLTGKTFLSTSVSGATIPGDGPLEVTFPEAGRIAATAGCNRHMGEVTFAGSTLTPGPLAATMMACPGARGESDAWLSDLFGSPLTWSLSGKTLTLHRDDLTVELAQRADTELVGPTWTVRSLVHDSGVESSVVIDRAAARLTFTADGRVTGFTGCNDLGGNAQITDGTIRFQDIVTTRKACDEEVMRVEQTVMDTLRGAATYRIDGDQLSLTSDADPGVGLRLTAG